MVHNGILMETIGISVTFSLGFSISWAHNYIIFSHLCTIWQNYRLRENVTIYVIN